MRTFLIAMLALFIAQSLRADDAKKILDNLQKKYETLQDISLQFSQDVTFGVTGNKQAFTGKLTVKKGNKYRIEMENQTIVTDGKAVWSYSVDNGQVIIDKFKEDPNAITPDKILVNVPERYNTTSLGEEKHGDTTLSIIKLIPKNQNSNIKWMKIWADTDEWVMRKVQFEDISDNVTTYVIKDLKINTGVADSRFQFEPPADAQVIDLRQ